VERVCPPPPHYKQLVTGVVPGPHVAGVVGKLAARQPSTGVTPAAHV
jgi:hypothetical protein